VLKLNWFNSNDNGEATFLSNCQQNQIQCLQNVILNFRSTSSLRAARKGVPEKSYSKLHVFLKTNLFHFLVRKQVAKRSSVCFVWLLRHPHNWAQLFNFVFFFTLPTFFLIFIHFRQQLLCRSRIRRRRRWWWIRRSLPNYVQQIGMINYSSAASLILYRDAILSKKNCFS